MGHYRRSYKDKLWREMVARKEAKELSIQSTPTGAIAFYRPKYVIKNDGEDEDDPHDKLSDKSIFKSGNNDKPVTHGKCDWRFCPICNNSAGCDNDDVEYRYFGPQPPLGIPELDEALEAEMPMLSDLFEEAQDIAEDSNADVIVNVITQLGDSALVKDLRLNILKEMPPTCEYRKLQNKLWKWTRQIKNREDRLGLSMEGSGWTIDDEFEENPLIHERRLVAANRKVARYKARLGADTAPKPCNSCFSCKAKTVGTQGFLETEIPNLVVTNVSKLKNEILNLI